MKSQQAKDFLLAKIRTYEKKGKLSNVRATKDGILLSVNNGERWKSLLVSNKEINRIVGELE